MPVRSPTAAAAARTRRTASAGQIPPLRIGDDPMIGQRQPVPGPLQPLHEPHKPNRVQLVQPAVLDNLHQMVDPDTELVQREHDRRHGAVGVAGRISPESHTPS